MWWMLAGLEQPLHAGALGYTHGRLRSGGPQLSRVLPARLLLHADEKRRLDRSLWMSVVLAFAYRRLLFIL